MRFLVWFASLVFSLTAHAQDLPKGPSLVNFWASWCKTCLVELKEYELYQAKYPTVNLVLVNLDAEKKNADALLATLKLRATIIYDPDFALAQRYGLDSLPVSLVLGQDGKVIHVEKGFDPQRSKTEQLFKMAEPPTIKPEPKPTAKSPKVGP